MKFLACSALIACIAVASAMKNPAQRTRLEALLQSRVVSSVQKPGKIVGGQDASLGQFPWQGSMQSFWFGGHLCGLSVLSENYVVTAGHCSEAVGDDADGVTVTVGITNLNDRGQTVDVARLIKHENYDGWTISNDIAIMELAQPLVLDENVQPIVLGVGRTPVLDDGACTISGWGATDPNGSQYPNDLQYLEVAIISDAECGGTWNAAGVDFNGQNQICAGTAQGDSACFGDSGGPLVCKTQEDGEVYLFGATSFGYSTCGLPQWPVVWTELPSYIDWIESKTGPLRRPQ